MKKLLIILLAVNSLSGLAKCIGGKDKRGNEITVHFFGENILSSVDFDLTNRIIPVKDSQGYLYGESHNENTDGSIFLRKDKVKNEVLLRITWLNDGEVMKLPCE